MAMCLAQLIHVLQMDGHRHFQAEIMSIQGGTVTVFTNLLT